MAAKVGAMEGILIRTEGITSQAEALYKWEVQAE